MPSTVQRFAVSVQAIGVEGRGTRPRGIMPSARALITAAVMLLASSMPTQAQDTRLRGWGVLGMGSGSANIRCEGGGCTSDWNLHGPTLLIGVAVMLNRHVGVGVVVDNWWRDPADSEATSTGVLMVHYYPSVRPHAFVEAGAGLSLAQVRLDGGRHADGRGLGLMAAAGYDVHLLGRHDSKESVEVTLTPRVSYVYSSIGDLRYDASSRPFATRWRHEVLALGLGVGFRGGW
jgi:hypothetical protein